MSSISESSFQDFGQPIAVGMVSTEGEKLLNALRKIQFKLKDKPKRVEQSIEKSLFSGHHSDRSVAKELHKCCTMCSSGDHHLRADHKSHKCPEPVICGHKPTEDLSNQLIEMRLKLIETQLQNISMQLMANNSVKHDMNGHKLIDKSLDPKLQRRTSPPKTITTSRITNIEAEIGSDDKYDASINAIKQMVRSADNRKISKSVSLDTINHKNPPSKHFHLQYKDIPFILGTNVRQCLNLKSAQRYVGFFQSSKSHSVIANRQIEISRLKQHNQLCSNRLPNRQIFDKTLKTHVLDNEIKELLYDLHEDHNYICE